MALDDTNGPVGGKGGGGVCIRLNGHIGRSVTTDPRVDGELVTQLASQQRVNWHSEFASYISP